MKKIIAALLVLSTIVVLASCALIRKADEDPNAPKKDTEPVADTGETYATDFSDTIPEDKPAEPIRYTEEQAYDLLAESKGEEYGKENVKIEKTGELIAESSGTEYYIFNVSLPKKVETKPGDTSDGADSDSGTKPVEMEPPVPYYVSVNGVIHDKISDENIDTKRAKETFVQQYGEKDKESGAPYKLVYEGIVTAKGKLCYSFAVYTTAEEKDNYTFNYLVTLDGTLSAKTVKEH